MQSVDQALDMPDLSLQMRVRCLRRLCRACSYHGILPGTLRIPTCYDRTAFPLYMGAYAGVWKGVHCGRDVAVKVLRTYSNNDLQKVHGVSCLLRSVLPHTWALTMHCVEVLQEGVSMENIPASKRSAVDWSVAV